MMSVMFLAIPLEIAASFETIVAIGDLPAGEGFGAVLGVALNGLLALALIFGVLMILDRAHKKKTANSEKESGESEEQASEKNEASEENGEEP